MNATEFAFWLRGVMSTTMTPGDQAALVIAEVRRGLGSDPVKFAPPQMKSIAVRRFCIHNVRVSEWCNSCPDGGRSTRLFMLALPATSKLVYITAHDDTSSRDENAEAGAEATERAGTSNDETQTGASRRG